MKMITLDEFKTRAKIVHGDRYDYSRIVYVNNYTKVEIICSIHGSFWQDPRHHYKSGCKQCADFEKSQTQQEFIENADAIFDSLYDYSFVRYKNQTTKVDIICPFHGIFSQIPKSHLNGHGCRKCYDAKPKLHAHTKETFAEIGNQVHGGKYDYSKVIYTYNKAPVEIICPIHEEFWQTPNYHMNGGGCPRCTKRLWKLTTEIFIGRANRIHDFRYNYSRVVYENGASKVEIICPTHGTFWQVAQDHLSGHGCHKCFSTVSHMETEWLDLLNIPPDQQHRNVYLNISGKKFKVDGYNNGVIYEFYGDFWHGNPETHNPRDINQANKKSFDTLYKDTIKREESLQKAGYKVVSIWESDWIELKKKMQK